VEGPKSASEKRKGNSIDRNETRALPVKKAPANQYANDNARFFPFGCVRKRKCAPSKKRHTAARRSALPRTSRVLACRTFRMARPPPRRAGCQRGCVTMSTDRRLRFAHRFKSGALCEVEIDLEAVRDNSFTPHFRWRGTTHKAHEFICWAAGRVQNRRQSRRGSDLVVLCPSGERGNRDLDFRAARETAKDSKGGGTSCNPASAIMIAATAKFATQSAHL
jgi:hypothetical protein